MGVDGYCASRIWLWEEVWGGGLWRVICCVEDGEEDLVKEVLMMIVQWEWEFALAVKD